MLKKKINPWADNFPAVWDPSDYYGFIYLISFPELNLRYIGKKGFHRWKGTKRVGESNWRNYKSSSVLVNNLIKENNKYIKKIILLCNTKSTWSHAENNIMHKLDVLTKQDEKGSLFFLNRHINATQWVPKDFPEKEVNQLVTNLLCEIRDE